VLPVEPGVEPFCGDVGEPEARRQSFARQETLRQVVEAEEKQIVRATRQATLVPNWSAKDCQSAEGRSRVYLGCDGVKVPLVTEAEKKKRRETIRKKRQRRGRKCKPLPRRQLGADNAHKEFKVALLFDESKTHRNVDATRGNHEVAGRMTISHPYHKKTLEGLLRKYSIHEWP